MQSNEYTMSVPVKVNKLTKVMKSEFLNLEPLSCDSAFMGLGGQRYTVHKAYSADILSGGFLCS